MRCPRCGANLVIAKKSDVFITVKKGKIYAQPIVEIDLDVQTKTINHVKVICPVCNTTLKEQKVGEV